MGERLTLFKMDSFFSSIKQSAVELADTTERKAKTAKSQAKILYAERCIKDLKEKFGVAVWESVAAKDQETVDALWAESNALVAEQEAEIAEQNAIIERLSVPGGR